MDLFPTISKLADIPIPSDRIIDGVDMSQILFEDKMVWCNDYSVFTSVNMCVCNMYYVVDLTIVLLGRTCMYVHVSMYTYSQEYISVYSRAIERVTSTIQPFLILM